MERRIRKHAFGRWMTGLAMFLWLGWPGDGVDIDAKELPIPATIQELLSQPDRYDGQRVFVNGRVRTIKMETGRRGSEYMGMVLEEAASDTDPGSSVRVFSLTVPRVGKGNPVSVQGTYHRQGRFGGWPYDDFIEADTIILDK